MSHDVLDLAVEQHRSLAGINQKQPDLTRSPPDVTSRMFPGLLDEVVHHCCDQSEAAPVAVAANCLVHFAALVGSVVYIPIGNERRRLNEFFLMVGPTGMGKGSSWHGPKQIFRQTEECLATRFTERRKQGNSEDIDKYPELKIHTGGLSSSEGMAASLDDSEVTDKRMLVCEPEFGNIMTQCQRQGNTLSAVMRNAYDGVDIKPLTKRNRVQVTEPYICLMANTTAQEFNRHDISNMLHHNGMLNRFLILWQHPPAPVPFPPPVADSHIEALAEAFADRILFARNYSYQTDYRKTQPRPLSLDPDAKSCWAAHYNKLINRPDCEQVTSLTRRHRLHALLLASYFALLDYRMSLSSDDIHTALDWCAYSHASVVYISNSQAEQYQAEGIHLLSGKILFAIRKIYQEQGKCSASDIYHWFRNKLRRKQLQASLEVLLNSVPPKIKQLKVVDGPGRPSLLYCPV